MADITDPEVIRFVNEEIRPLCEAVRALKARIDSTTVRWYAGINAKTANDSGYLLIDDRELQGVSRLTGGDINLVMGQLIAIAPDAGIIAKPCVRPLEAH